MGFINEIRTVIRKSSGDILVFYINEKRLFLREFIKNEGWNNEKQIINNVVDNQFNIQIDDEDNIYGIANIENGKIVYIYTDENKDIKYKKLFDYNNEKYILINPHVIKKKSNVYIIYYIQDVRDTRIWAIFSHYFDGEKWSESSIDFIVSYPVVNPFFINFSSDNLNIFYFNKVNEVEEIYLSRFNSLNKFWTEPEQLTSTNNKKIYLNVLQDDMNFYHITWSEFVNENLVVKYMNGYLKDSFKSKSDVVSLSEKSNCSFPTLIKTGKTLWNVWTQMNKLYNCYSFDNGKTWSEVNLDNKSIDINFIRYKFRSNNIDDLKNFKLDTTFGTSYPKISFIGFENIRKDG
ncbi:hypothetical protein [Tepidibacter thalassicus]|uniref:BNR repeat-containing family member n=1 Tax=Tepidibacter thalassicus DSM 15285 TaxID=1123350 RepID=A0A1M5PEQ2_9FIRM|nr:hypothetical protein [Tepidibacter thalassicus]SHH00256.1 hypothetical protein SAMN02744040_00443 [Tepidibacter thalassicus DSM 15285]